MNRRKDISKEHLYESVKTLLETDANHIHLPQQKLFTLFSVAFQYLLYSSTKKPGAYIIRIEDSYLAEKLCRKAKDDTTRKFIQRLILPRRLKYKDSTFYLDYFHMGSWANTNDIPPERLRSALVVKNTTSKPFNEMGSEEEETPSYLEALEGHEKTYYLTSLQERCPETIVIAFEENYNEVEKISFPFIKSEIKALNGVKLASDINIEVD